MEPIIIPVASGKGGVGKTLLSANLAITLAAEEHRTVAADLDFGAANLHSFLQLPNDNPGIGDFLLARSAELPELLVATPDPRLALLPGDGQSPFMANLTYAHKMRLQKALHTLDCRYLVLDLGAGSAYNTLDFFLLADNGLLVTTPDLPAVMNLMVFLKNLVLRIVSREIRRDEHLGAVLKEELARPLRAPAVTVNTMLDQIGAIDPAVAQRVAARLERLTPRLVFNMGEDPAELHMATKIAANIEQRLNVKIECCGYIPHDPQVRSTIRGGQAFLPACPASPAAHAIKQLARRLVANWSLPLPHALEQLEAEARHQDKEPLSACG